MLLKIFIKNYLCEAQDTEPETALYSVLCSQCVKVAKAAGYAYTSLCMGVNVTCL